MRELVRPSELFAEGPILYADVTPRAGELPPRYSAPLPSRQADLWHHAVGFPPWDWVTSRLGARDPEMRQRVIDALGRAKGKDIDPVVKHYAYVLSRPAGNEDALLACTREILEAVPEPLARRLRNAVADSAQTAGFRAMLGLPVEPPREFPPWTRGDELADLAKRLEGMDARILHDPHRLARECDDGVSAMLHVRGEDAIVEAVMALEPHTQEDDEDLDDEQVTGVEHAPEPWPVDEEAPLRDHYRLRAYENGRRWEVVGGDTSDWLDVDSAIGLVNTVLKHRGLPLRAVALPPDHGRARILVAPEHSIFRATGDRVLGFTDERLPVLMFVREA